mgnify:CR=1 FL=1
MTIPLVVGVSGKMGVGKDYLIDTVIKPMFQEAGLNVAVLGFADQIKVNAAAQAGLEISRMFGDKTPEIRRMLQVAGTEQGRDVHGPDVWVNIVAKWIEIRAMRDQTQVFIIPDCRFRNELAWIKRQPNHLVLRIEAPKRNLARLKKEAPEGNLEAISQHPSEIDLDGLDPDQFNLVYNNDGVGVDKFRASWSQLVSSSIAPVHEA